MERSTLAFHRGTVSLAHNVTVWQGQQRGKKSGTQKEKEMKVSLLSMNTAMPGHSDLFWRISVESESSGSSG